MKELLESGIVAPVEAVPDHRIHMQVVEATLVIGMTLQRHLDHHKLLQLRITLELEEWIAFFQGQFVLVHVALGLLALGHLQRRKLITAIVLSIVSALVPAGRRVVRRRRRGEQVALSGRLVFGLLFALVLVTGISCDQVG